MEIKEFKIRCSAIGQIMTNPRSKSETLSQTCKSYLEEWVKEQVYGVQKQIKSKYLTKGLDVEDIAIEYYSEQKGLGFVLKNTDYYFDEFMHGTPDLVLPEMIIDLKASWDCFSFPLFASDIDKSYYAQIQGYMHLTGRKKGKLVYTLQNTPDELVWDEPIDYSEISSKYRIKEYEIEYDAEFIQSVQTRVLECREYINQLIEQIR